MGTQRKKYNGAFKTRIVVAVLRGTKTINEIAGIYGVHPSQINNWKKEALKGLPTILSDKRARKDRDFEKEREELYEQIGRLTMDVNWLKKKVEI